MAGFTFKKFTVNHDLCAMKVGTDGVLLGAWANGGRRILDVGTGSGLIALFMAQRFQNAVITAVDIDTDACDQALANIKASVFADRIKVVNSSIQEFHCNKFDTIVCNPPFFNNALKSGNKQRDMARHTDALPYRDLFGCVAASLDDNGEFSVIIPTSCRASFDMEALFSGLYTKRLCAVKTVPHKTVSRYLISYSKQPPLRVETTEECINDAFMNRSEWYTALTKDFYL